MLCSPGRALRCLSTHQKTSAARGGRCESRGWIRLPGAGRRAPEIGRDRRAIAAEFRVERPMIVIDHATAVIGIEGFPIGVTTLQLGGAVEMVPVDRRLVT